MNGLVPALSTLIVGLSLYAIGQLSLAERIRALSTQICAAVALGLSVYVASASIGTDRAFSGALIDDPLARMAHSMILGATAVVLLISKGFLIRRAVLNFEYPILVLVAAAGTIVAVSSGNLLITYVGLELCAVAIYALCAYNTRSPRAAEAALKFVVLGGVASSLFLYGIALIYGATGSIALTDITAALAAEEGVGLIGGIGLLLVCIGMASKAAMAPFHAWMPDVAEGAPIPVAAFVATAIVAATAIVLVRLLFQGFEPLMAVWRPVMLALASVSLAVSAIGMIGQTNLRRFLGYALIGQLGCAALGIGAGTEAGVASAMTHLLVFGLALLGLYAFLMTMERDGQSVSKISDLSGLARLYPGQAALLGLLTLSLAGLPPVAGFFSKLLVLWATVEAGHLVVATLAGIAMIVGSFGYLWIIKVMYVDAHEETLDLQSGPFERIVLFGAAAVMLIGAFPLVGGFGVHEASQAAAAALIE
ncbi:MAG: NADH-quinone oxidoreductase subunit N [Pseudomonadota bacterium]